MPRGLTSQNPTDIHRTLGNSIDRTLLHVVDGGLIGVLFVAPLFMGGRHEIGRAVFVALICVLSVAWMLRQLAVGGGRWRWTGLEWLLLAGFGVILLQLLPLSAAALQALSPEIDRLLPLWTAGNGTVADLGAWQTLSFTPYATRTGLVIYLAYAMLGLVVVQRIEHRADVERIMRWLALAAVVMAVIGLAQFLLGNGKFLWIYEHPHRTANHPVKGPFQNQNHFAHMLALGLGPLIWWLQRIWKSPPDAQQAFRSRGGRSRGGRSLRSRLADSATLKQSLMIGLGLVLLAALLTFSRGGVISIATAGAVCIGVYWRRGFVGKKAMVAVAAAMLMLGVALTIYGYEPLMNKLRTLPESQSLEELSRGRERLWAAHLRAIPQFIWTGTGVGSHRYIYRTYMPEHFGVEFTHGENGYLHLALEAGLPAVGLMLFGAGIVVFWLLRPIWRSEDDHTVAIAGALLAGIAASLIHSLGDFVWYIPACMSMTVIIAATACRTFQLEAATRSADELDARSWRAWFSSGLALPLGRPIQCVLAGGTVLLAIAMLVNLVPQARVALHWDQYLKISQLQASWSEEQAPKYRGRMIDHLQTLLEHDAAHHRAHMRLAALYLQQFDTAQQASENPMVLSQIRDAALASQFPTLEAQDRWLEVVMGENREYLDLASRHVYRGLRQNPLEGDGYIYLAELAFLSGAPPETKAEFVEQALTVRPHNALVMLAAGSEAAVAGELERALELWKASFHQAPQQRNQIIEMLSPQMPAAAFIEQFEPDSDGLYALFRSYRTRGDNEAAVLVANHLLPQLETEAEDAVAKQAVGLWSLASSLYGYCGDWPEAERCARSAVHFAPNDLAKRRELANAAMKNGNYAEAVKQLQWCLARVPDNEQLRRSLETANRHRIANRAEPSPSN